MDPHESLGGMVMFHLGCVFPLSVQWYSTWPARCSCLDEASRASQVHKVPPYYVPFAAWTLERLLLTCRYNMALRHSSLHKQGYRNTLCMCTLVGISPWSDSLNSCNVATFHSLCAYLVGLYCRTKLRHHAPAAVCMEFLHLGLW